MRATAFAAGLGLALTLGASPAFAQYGDGRYAGASYARPDAAYPQTYPQTGGYRIDRTAAERCGFRAGSVNPYPTPLAYHDGPYRRDDGVGGALIGGAVGGLIGNRVAGRHHRTVGTIAGAAVGAVAGAAIDRAEDRGRVDPDLAPLPVAADACEALLPPGYMLVSVPGGQECRDEVVTREEWVPEYVTVPRAAPRDKRTKLRRIK